MAQFTLIELHFEEGAIPGIDTQRNTASDDTDGETAGPADAGGPSLPKTALMILAVVAAIALVRQLLGGDASPLEGDDVLDDAAELVE